MAVRHSTIIDRYMLQESYVLDVLEKGGEWVLACCSTRSDSGCIASRSYDDVTACMMDSPAAWAASFVESVRRVSCRTAATAPLAAGGGAAPGTSSAAGAESAGTAGKHTAWVNQ